MHLKMLLMIVLATFVIMVDVRAETIVFGEGDKTFSIEFVDIGSPGNLGDDDERLSADLQGVGSVSYEYQIAKFETPCSELNVALGLGAFSDPVPAAVCSGDVVPGLASPLTILEFVNWLNVSSGMPPAYRWEVFGILPWPEDDPSYNSLNPLRNAGARYFLPTTDEWYKAAFYDPEKGVYYDYATGSDEPPVSVTGGTDSGTAVYCLFTPGDCAPGGPRNTAPVTMAGGLSPYGTMGQLGNGSEWEEEQRYLWTGVHTCGLPNPGLCGTEAWNTRWPSSAVGTNVGFRVVAMTIPEPRFGTWLFVLLGFQVLRRRIRASSPRCAA